MSICDVPDTVLDHVRGFLPCSQVFLFCRVAKQWNTVKNVPLVLHITCLEELPPEHVNLSHLKQLYISTCIMETRKIVFFQRAFYCIVVLIEALSTSKKGCFLIVAKMQSTPYSLFLFFSLHELRLVFLKVSFDGACCFFRGFLSFSCWSFQLFLSLWLSV